VTFHLLQTSSNAVDFTVVQQVTITVAHMITIVADYQYLNKSS